MAEFSDNFRDSVGGPFSVIGLGRFGLFWAGMLAAERPVLGTSRRTITGLPDGVRQVSLKEAVQSEVIFLAVSISALPEVLEEIAPMVRRDAIVIDTCSVKVFPAAEMQRLLPPQVDIVACHPMFGPDSAGERSDPLPVITWPVRDTYRRYTGLLDLFRSLNMRVVEMNPEDHDREAAFSQGVTHFVGRILREMDLQPSTIATLGYTRLLQVMEQTCNDPLQLFQDLQRYNPYTRDMRRRFSRALEATESLLLDSEKQDQ
jgi:prephenate dehydrogenase